MFRHPILIKHHNKSDIGAANSAPKKRICVAIYFFGMHVKEQAGIMSTLDQEIFPLF
jgi:hypothetical protein